MIFFHRDQKQKKSNDFFSFILRENSPRLIRFHSIGNLFQLNTEEIFFSKTFPWKKKRKDKGNKAKIVKGGRFELKMRGFERDFKEIFEDNLDVTKRRK